MGRSKPDCDSYPFGQRYGVMIRDQHSAARHNDQAASGCPKQDRDKKLPAVTKVRERRVRAAIGICSHTSFWLTADAVRDCQKNRPSLSNESLHKEKLE